MARQTTLDPPPTASTLITPTLRACTYNICGFSPNNPIRNRAITKNLTYLFKHFDIVMLQETHLAHEHTLVKAFPTHTILQSCLSSTAAGTATLISQSVTNDYAITKHPLHSSLKGHAIALQLQPLNNNSFTLPTVNIINVRLDASSNSERVQQLRRLKSIPQDIEYNILGGDFNFTESEADTSGTPTASTELSRAWTVFLSRYNLREIHQPTHTRFQINTELHTSSSSRLDPSTVHTQ